MAIIRAYAVVVVVVIVVESRVGVMIRLIIRRRLVVI